MQTLGVFFVLFGIRSLFRGKKCEKMIGFKGVGGIANQQGFRRGRREGTGGVGLANQLLGDMGDCKVVRIGFSMPPNGGNGNHGGISGGDSGSPHGGDQKCDNGNGFVPPAGGNNGGSKDLSGSDGGQMGSPQQQQQQQQQQQRYHPRDDKSRLWDLMDKGKISYDQYLMGVAALNGTIKCGNKLAVRKILLFIGFFFIFLVLFLCFSFLFLFFHF